MKCALVAALAIAMAGPALGAGVEEVGSSPPVSFNDQDECLANLPETVHQSLVTLRKQDAKADSRIISADTMAANMHIWEKDGARRRDGRPWAVFSVVQTCHLGVLISKSYLLRTPAR